MTTEYMSPSPSGEVRRGVADAISLLQQMIAIPSTSRDEAGTAQLLHQYLVDKGIDAHLYYNNVWALNRHYDPAKPTLLLSSHHDTVKPSAAYTRDPYAPTIEEGRLYGLGSNDAGGPAVSLLTVFVNHYDDTDLSYNLLLDLSAAEECMGEEGFRAMLPEFGRLGISIDCALVGEPTCMQAAVGERGLVVLDCTAHGTQGHAARNEGDNAIYRALRDIQKLQDFQFERTSELLGPIKVTTTMIQAGTQHNVVPDRCTFVVDIRTTDAYTNQEVVDILQATLESDAQPRSTRVHASAISDDHPLVITAKALGRTTFVSPTTSEMALMPFPSLKMGPGDSARSHKADEYILLSEIEEGIDTYEKFILKLKP